MQTLEQLVLELAKLKEERRQSVKDYNEQIKELESELKRLARDRTAPASGQTA